MPQTGNTEKTQAEVLAEKLLKLKVDVTAQDRKDAVVELDNTIVTIHNYLNGKVSDNDTAVKMINFFTNRINNRYKALA